MSKEAPNFMDSPLATWVRTFANPGDVIQYDGLADGTFPHYVMTQIDPRAHSEQIILQCEDCRDRQQNWDIVMRNIRLYYEDVLQMYIIMKPPDVVTISKDPHSSRSQTELGKVLLLLLGCAVQCENKEMFIENIKTLHIDTQHAMVEFIQEITDDSRNMFPMSSPSSEEDESSTVQSKTLHHHVKQLLSQRDTYIEEIRDLVQATESLQSQVDLQAQKTSQGALTHGSSPANVTEKHHLGVEVAELKGRVRRLRQELEEKNELCQELKEELDEQNAILTKLRNENLSLTQDARSARAYRDEIDVLTQKAARADKLEAENARYKEKLNELDFYKARTEELRDDNLVLVESKMMLEEQLASGSKRVEQVVELENEVQKYKQQLEEVAKSRDRDRERVQELADENARLEHEMKSSMKESANLEHDLRKAQKVDSQGLGDSLSDQLRETANARILRLELDNTRLSKELAELHDQAVLENSSRQLELEKENQRLATKVNQLQEVGSKEAEKVEWLEEQTITISRDKEQMRRTLETVRESNERQVQELTVENQQLSRTIATLRERSEKTQDLRYRDMETENKRLQDSVRELSQRISRLDCDNKHLKTNHARLNADVERLKDVEEEKVHMERKCSELYKTVTALQATSKKTDELEQNMTDLEVENHRLSKTVENLQKSLQRLEELEQKNVTLTVENQKLQRTLTSAKNSSTKLVDLESEKDTLHQEIQSLKKSLEQEKMDRTKHEQTELDLLEVDSENQKLAKQNQSLQRRIEELQLENSQLENENRKLSQNLESLKNSLKKLNEMEKDNQELDFENRNLVKENGQYEKEVKRLRESLSGKETVIDDHTNRISELERELKSLHKNMDRSREAASRLKEVETENKDLLQTMTVDKRTLATLRQDLVNEKVRTQQLNNELEQVSQELEKIGLNKDKLVAAQETEGESRYKALESMMQQAYQKSLEIKEQKIHALESRLEESMSRNQKVQSELKLTRRKLEGLRQQVDEDGNNLNVSQDERNQNHLVRTPETKAGRVSTEVTLKTAHGTSTREILSIQERLVDVERTNATLTTENKILKMQTEESRKRISSMEQRNTTLQVQLSNSQQQYANAQMDLAKLQVENSTLNSNHSTLEAQLASTKSQLSALESDNEQIVVSHDELQAAHETLVTDHEQLQHIHEQLSTEYESLISEHGSLKAVHKALKTEYKDMSTHYNDYLQQKDNMGFLKDSIEQDRDKLRKEAMSLGSLQADYVNVKDENYRLNVTNQKLNTEYNTIYSEYKSMKNEYNNLQVKYSNLQSEFHECRDQLNTMDVELTKMANRVESLNALNCQLEEENRDLMQQLKALLAQNQDLLTQALQNKEQYHEDELAYVEKLSALKRQKEKLEEKIMEQYRRYDPSPKKSRGIGAKIAKKAKGLITRTRERSRSRGGTPLSPESSAQTGSQAGESPDTSSLGSYQGAIDAANTPRKTNNAKFLDSRVSHSESSGRLSRHGKFLSTTGLNNISSASVQGDDDTVNSFRLRGFKSTDNLLTSYDSERKLDDSGSSGKDSGKPKTPGCRFMCIAPQSRGSVAYSIQDDFGSDGAKDRLSQRSNSTDSSNTTSRQDASTISSVSQVTPGGRARLSLQPALNRTPDPSPRDGLRKGSVDYTEEPNNNSPRMQRKPFDQIDAGNLSRDSDKSRSSLNSTDSGPNNSRQSFDRSGHADQRSFDRSGLSDQNSRTSFDRSGLLDGPRPYQSPLQKKMSLDNDRSPYPIHSSPRVQGQGESGRSYGGLRVSEAVSRMEAANRLEAPVQPSHSAQTSSASGSGVYSPSGSGSYSNDSGNSSGYVNVMTSGYTPSKNGYGDDVNYGDGKPMYVTPQKAYADVSTAQGFQKRDFGTPSSRSISSVSSPSTNGQSPSFNSSRDSTPTAPQPMYTRPGANTPSRVNSVDRTVNQGAPPIRNYRHDQQNMNSRPAPSNNDVRTSQHDVRQSQLDVREASVDGLPSYPDPPPVRRRRRPQAGGEEGRVLPERPATVAAEPIRRPDGPSSDRRMSSGTVEYRQQYGTQNGMPRTESSGQIGGYDVRRRARQAATPTGDEYQRRPEDRRSGSGIIMRQSSSSGPPVPARSRRSGSNPNMLDDSVIPSRRQRNSHTLPARPKSVMATSSAPLTSTPAPRLATVKPYSATMLPDQSPETAPADPPPTGKKPVCLAVVSSPQPTRPPRRRRATTPLNI